MDRRSFLKALMVVPFTKEIVKSFIEPVPPEPVEELVIDWRDTIIDDETSFAYYNDGTPDVIYRHFEYDEQVFKPSRTHIGEYEVVGTVKALECYRNFNVQIRTGHCDES